MSENGTADSRLTGEEKMGAPQLLAEGGGAAEAAIMHSLGVSAFQRGKTETALKFMSRACAHPDAPAVWHRNHAEILDRSGNSQAAEAAARLALARDPDYADAWETLGTILAQRDQHTESCACYERAIEIEPNSVQALNNLAVTLDRLGRPYTAVARYRQVLRLAPESPEIQLNFATLLGELGHHEEGLEIVGEVLNRCPNSKRARSLATEFRVTRSEQRKNTSVPYALPMLA
jgi:Tfp pilus assembly protein PilF